MKCEFIGGPKDGDVIEFPELPEILFPRAPDLQQFFKPEDSIPSIKCMNTYIYVRVGRGVYHYKGPGEW
jgi:hypothetical protein